MASVTVPRGNEADVNRDDAVEEPHIVIGRGKPASDPHLKMKHKKVIVAVPAYNEEIAIAGVVLRSLKYADEVVVIDDGSTDRTTEVAKLAGAVVVGHQKNEGKGAAIRDAFYYAKQFGADILVLIDGDGQHDPEEIPFLIKPILDKKAEMVNGSRFLVKNGHRVPKYRRMGQEVLTMATNTGTKQKITDTQNGFRAFSKSTFDCFSLKQNGMAIESEMLMDASDAKMRIVEVPITVRYDVEGSTYHPVRHGTDVLGRVIGLVSQRRPILFFCVPGTAMMGIGTACAFLLLTIFNSGQYLAVEFGLGTVLFIMLGMLLISTGLMLASIQTMKNKIN